MKRSLVLSMMFFVTSSAFGMSPISQLGLGFTVPTTSNHGALDSPQQGEIVLDTGTSAGFYGFDGTSWQTLGDGAGAVGKMANLGLSAATVSVANDSIKITGASGQLSTSNPAYVRVPDGSGGAKLFVVTSDVTITPTGAVWGQDGRGDLTGAILRVVALNDAGTLRWGLAYIGGRTLIKSANASSTAASAVDPESVLVSSNIANNSGVLEVGWVRVNYADSTDRWIVSTTSGGINVGTSADGVWQPFGSAGSVTGCSGAPTAPHLEWAMTGETVQVRSYFYCTSNSTAFSFVAPVKASSVYEWSSVFVHDAGLDQNTPGVAFPAAAGGRTITLYKNVNTPTWTASSTKAVYGGLITYKMYQP